MFYFQSETAHFFCAPTIHLENVFFSVAKTYIFPDKVFSFFLSRVLLEVNRVPPLHEPVLGLALDLDDLVLGQFEAAHHGEAEEDAKPAAVAILHL